MNEATKQQIESFGAAVGVLLVHCNVIKYQMDYQAMDITVDMNQDKIDLGRLADVQWELENLINNLENG